MKSELQASLGLHDPVVCHLPHMSPMIWDSISTSRSATRAVQSPPVDSSSVLVDLWDFQTHLHVGLMDGQEEN